MKNSSFWNFQNFGIFKISKFWKIHISIFKNSKFLKIQTFEILKNSKIQILEHFENLKNYSKPLKDSKTRKSIENEIIKQKFESKSKSRKSFNYSKFIKIFENTPPEYPLGRHYKLVAAVGWWTLEWLKF